MTFNARVFLLAFALGLACVPATYRAGVRRLAEADARACRHATFEDDFRTCYKNVQAFCVARGLERSCGDGYIR